MIFIDQMNREVDIPVVPPKKIISLVPSITELLVKFDLEDNIVAITKFCIHPENTFKTKEKIGGTKNLNIDKIKKLQPDLIIGNKEENVQQQINELSNYFPVWMSDVNTFDDAINMINQLGIILNRQYLANLLIQEIQTEFKKLENQQHFLFNKKVLYLIWYDPIMAVANSTYIHNILQKIGAINVLEHQQRYVQISFDEIKQLQPDYILLSSEPFPFKEKHKNEIQKNIGSDSKIIFVDGELFSWYGYRMKFLPEYLLKFKVD